jgi:hypothetical protein
MADCKYCGKPAGFRVGEHEACRKAKEAGISAEEIAEQARTFPPRPLTAGGVFWAVFGALCLYGLLSGIITAIAK